MQRDVFLEVLKDSYSAYYNIVPAESEDELLMLLEDLGS